jgi:hypothetical protein
MNRGQGRSLTFGWGNLRCRKPSRSGDGTSPLAGEYFVGYIHTFQHSGRHNTKLSQGAVRYDFPPALVFRRPVLSTRFYSSAEFAISLPRVPLDRQTFRVVPRLLGHDSIMLRASLMRMHAKCTRISRCSLSRQSQISFIDFSCGFVRGVIPVLFQEV